MLKELMVVPCAIVQTQDSSRTTFLFCKVADFCYPDNALQQGVYFNGHFACEILAKGDGSGTQVSTCDFLFPEACIQQLLEVALNSRGKVMRQLSQEVDKVTLNGMQWLKVIDGVVL